MRLETIRKKKNAVQKFLKNDIVDLLRNSLDYNAYGRAEGFLVEQNMAACYELIAKFVECMLGHVRDLFKQSDCPDECKEAIPSLIYAAARFSDLPELRELRTLFQEKFGNTLEPYTSKEFIERLRQNPPSKEMKIQLLHDLAQDFSIEWDRKALEQRLYSPISHQEKEKPKHDDQLLQEKEKPKYDDKLLQENEKPKHDDRQKDNGELKLQKNVNDDNINYDDPWWRMLRRTDSETTTPDRSSIDDQKACSSSIETASEDDEAEIKRPFSYKSVPPPYIKTHKVENNLMKSPEALTAEKPVPRSVRRRPLRPPPEENIVKDFSKTGGSFDEKEILDGLLMQQILKQSPNDKEQKRRYRKSSSSVPTTMRGKSLPQRATSLVPELLRTTSEVSGHVHPSLPDYEDLSARLASLRRT
ncbi:IST1-like protein [Trifolium pratense]|nr:IST1-like protein [Trifolium pratense]